MPREQAEPSVQHGSAGRDGWRVLVVESDPRAAEHLVQSLRRHGHEAVWVDTGGKALRAYRSAEMVLIDLELPDLDGLEVCREIRAAGDTPVIAVTARGAELDRVLGLQAGSDDYLVKPYGFLELIARMEAVMRRVRPRPAVARPIARGALLIEAGCREVSVAGRPVDLTRKEFDLLHLLASQPDAVVPRAQIERQVWGNAEVSRSRTIDTHVNSLRNKLGAGTWIVTVRGVGFRFGHG
ncbi:response regulator transcription factor [Saccharothrix sp. ST-888]|uniref:response regulator transcription factor n=1 Tax=Saccharothrix sp. ST-888 TaxID=1427391 RepID=UPI0018CD0BE7|nr:response regulator transcription factor [Saccharothrix sp. ST-888]